MTEPAAQPSELPTVMADASELEALLNTPIHLPRAPQPARCGLEPTLITQSLLSRAAAAAEEEPLYMGPAIPESAIDALEARFFAGSAPDSEPEAAETTPEATTDSTPLPEADLALLAPSVAADEAPALADALVADAAALAGAAALADAAALAESAASAESAALAGAAAATNAAARAQAAASSNAAALPAGVRAPGAVKVAFPGRAARLPEPRASGPVWRPAVPSVLERAALERSVRHGWLKAGLALGGGALAAGLTLALAFAALGSGGEQQPVPPAPVAQVAPRLAPPLAPAAPPAKPALRPTAKKAKSAPPPARPARRTVGPEAKAVAKAPAVAAQPSRQDDSVARLFDER